MLIALLKLLDLTIIFIQKTDNLRIYNLDQFIAKLVNNPSGADAAKYYDDFTHG